MTMPSLYARMAMIRRQHHVMLRGVTTTTTAPSIRLRLQQQQQRNNFHQQSSSLSTLSWSPFSSVFDDDDEATTDGAGLSFGILKTLGLSLPAGVGDVRLRFIQGINGPLVQAGIAPKAVSDPQDVPSWWTNEKRGADP